MARSSGATRLRGKKDTRNPVRVATSDATAMTGTVPFNRPIVCPQPTKDTGGCVGTSSSNVQSTLVDAMKPRADSILTTKLNDMATKQILAELEATLPSPKRVRISVSSITTNGHDSTLADGLQKISCLPAEAWSYSGGAMMLFVFLVALIWAWPQLCWWRLKNFLRM